MFRKKKKNNNRIKYNMEAYYEAESKWEKDKPIFDISDLPTSIFSSISDCSLFIDWSNYKEKNYMRL